MNRNYLRWGVDVTLALALLVVLLTGLLMEFVLPSGSVAGPGAGRWEVWGWNRHEWGDVHFWAAMAALGVGFIHLVLQWKWVCATTVRMFTGGRNAAGLGPAGRRWAAVVTLALAALLLTVFLWSAKASMQQGAGQGQHLRGQGRHQAPVD